MEVDTPNQQTADEETSSKLTDMPSQKLVRRPNSMS